MEKSNIERIKELTVTLNHHRDAYYNKSNPEISDYEYDSMFDELSQLEKTTGFCMVNSPTKSVGYEVKSKLDKVTHSHPMLSLGKTKSVDDLIAFAGDKECLLMLKMDGLTVLLTYDDGELVQAETRGNGEIGEIITHNAKVFKNIPLTIPYKEYIEIEGEAIITYEDFNKINETLSEDEKYKNPRNLVSGSVRQLDSEIAASRNIKFIAWKVPSTYVGDKYINNSMLYRFQQIERVGFDVVPLWTYTNKSSDKENINQIIGDLKNKADTLGYPIDGLVMAYNDMEYGMSLGSTGHHPKHSIAYKFYDEEVSSILRDVEFTMGKTGSLCPVAIFDTVEIDGTEVSRASLHNISICKPLELGIGDEITVYKSNMIIPQIRENLTKSNTLQYPSICPICGKPTEIKKDNDSEVLVCTNPDCKGKLLGKLSHAVSKNALNIDGLSESTIEKMIGLGLIEDLTDIYWLRNHWEQVERLEGFGSKSAKKLFDAIENSRNTTLDRFLYALSIPNIGRTASKAISKYCNGDFGTFIDRVNTTDWTQLDDFGDTMHNSILQYFKDNMEFVIALSKEFTFEKPKAVVTTDDLKDLSGKTFVITGSLEHFANRDEAKERIELFGGKVSGSVSKKTDYLVNNDITSTSGKNAKAKELGIPIISEEQLLQMIE